MTIKNAGYLLWGASLLLVLLGCDSNALETGHFEAAINSDHWQGQGYAEFSAQGELIIRAEQWRSGNLEEILLFVAFEGAKTYRLPEGKAWFRSSIGGDVAGVFYESFGGAVDQISIVEYDESQGRFSGTFTFDARGERGELQVRDGRFAVELLPWSGS